MCRHTQIPKEVRDEYLRDMRKIYTSEAYSLFHNNCNDFTNDFSNFLTGSGIPVCLPLYQPPGVYDNGIRCASWLQYVSMFNYYPSLCFTQSYIPGSRLE